MFVVDFLAASVLATAFTIGFAAIVRGGGYRRLGEMSMTVWLLSLASWAAGILIVAFGPLLTGTHWIPFAVTGLIFGLLALGLIKLPRSRRSLHTETGNPGNDARPAIALYFFVTLLLFFCAISLRFYLVYLG